MGLSHLTLTRYFYIFKKSRMIARVGYVPLIFSTFYINTIIKKKIYSRKLYTSKVTNYFVYLINEMEGNFPSKKKGNGGKFSLKKRKFKAE